MVDPDKLAWAAHLREQGDTIAQITAKTGITRTTLYRHLPPRPVEQVTVAPTTGDREPAANPTPTGPGVGAPVAYSDIA